LAEEIPERRRRGTFTRDENYSLVVFDVEGVIIPKRRYMLFEVAGSRGLKAFLWTAILGILYEAGLISVESALKRLFKSLRGLTLQTLFNLYRKVPLAPGVEMVFARLRRAGVKTALISSGIPRVLVEDLAKRLGADYAVGPEIGLDDGRLTGEVWGPVIKASGKVVALMEMLHRESIPGSRCVIVADDRNNLPLFEVCGLSVGYNPDFIVQLKSDVVVKGELPEVLPKILGADETISIHRPKAYEREVLREAIHAGGFSVPILCTYLLDRYLVALLILLVTIVFVASEITRLKSGRPIPIFQGVTLRVASGTEVQEFVLAPVFFALGIILSLILFPTPLNYVSITVLTLGDSSASIFGKRLGRRVIPYNKGKMVEGTLCGLLSAFCGALLFVSPFEALIAASTGMLFETLPSPIDDNITIPISSGLALTILQRLI